MHVCGWVGRKWASECNCHSQVQELLYYSIVVNGGVSPPLKHPQQQQQHEGEENFLRNIVTVYHGQVEGRSAVGVC